MRNRMRALLGEALIAVGHPALDLGGALHGIDDAGELDQRAVADGLDDAAVMLADRRIDQFAAMRLHAFERADLICAHEARSHHVGGKDRGDGGWRSWWSLLGRR